MASPLLALIALLALVSIVEHRASGSGTLVVIEDASQLGSGSFSGNVCYQVIRDRDGVTISEGCFSIAATIAAPEGFDTSEQYIIIISLADAECMLLNVPRTGNGTTPFSVRVSCDAAYLTATANAGGPSAPDSELATETPAVELTAWPPVYEPPTVVTIGPGSAPAPMPMASPIPMTDTKND